MIRSLIIVSVLAVCFSVSCCKESGYAELGLVEVTGRVTLDGQPLSGAKVAFESDDKRTAIGTTDSSGVYILMYDSQTPGTAPGAKTVRITTADVDVEGGGAGEGAPVTKEKVPTKYNEKSELKADVSASKKTFDFDLKSAP